MLLASVADFPDQQIVDRYKALADIDRAKLRRRRRKPALLRHPPSAAFAC